MLNYDEIVERMARAIYSECPDIIKKGSGGIIEVTVIPFEDAKNRKAICILQAEAALKALIECLPDITKQEPFSGFIENLVRTDAVKLYQQLKNLGK